MNEHGGTVTAPIYGDIVIAILVVLAAMTIIAITQAVVQKVRTAGSQVDGLLAEGLAEIDLDRWDHEVDDVEERCCPTPQAAARNLCYCWGGGSGQWIGSAS